MERRRVKGTKHGKRRETKRETKEENNREKRWQWKRKRNYNSISTWRYNRELERWLGRGMLVWLVISGTINQRGSQTSAKSVTYTNKIVR